MSLLQSPCKGCNKTMTSLRKHLSKRPECKACYKDSDIIDRGAGTKVDACGRGGGQEEKSNTGGEHLQAGTDVRLNSITWGNPVNVSVANKKATTSGRGKANQAPLKLRQDGHPVRWRKMRDPAHQGAIS